MWFVSDLRQVGGFLRVLRFPPSIKTDRHNITEELLKVALNTISHKPSCKKIQFVQLAQSIYSTLMGRFWMSLGTIPFSKILLTVLFDTLTNNVSFLFLFLIKHLFKCVALLCIYIIVIVLLLIYMWDFNYFMYVFSYE
jgi:hypothetical protein